MSSQSPPFFRASHQASTVPFAVTTTPGFKAAFAQYAEGGWQGLQHPSDFGGQGLPKTIGSAAATLGVDWQIADDVRHALRGSYHDYTSGSIGRAIFQIGSVKEIFVALFGCFKAGVVPLCTLPQYREIEIKSLGERAGAVGDVDGRDKGVFASRR